MDNIDQQLLSAFVEGAKWWEWQDKGATMWKTDADAALGEAKKRLDEGKLGILLAKLNETKNVSDDSKA